jgi:hypothetical protein
LNWPVCRVFQLMIEFEISENTTGIEMGPASFGIE